MGINFLGVGKVGETCIEVLARGALDGSGSFGGAHGLFCHAGATDVLHGSTLHDETAENAEIIKQAAAACLISLIKRGGRRDGLGLLDDAAKIPTPKTSDLNFGSCDATQANLQPAVHAVHRTEEKPPSLLLRKI